MNSMLTNFKYLPTKALLLSVGLHALVFNSFIIVFPTLPQPHKPNIIFIGSILASSDVMASVTPQRNQENQINHIQFKEKSTRSYQPGLEKPTRFKEYTPQNKTTVKMEIVPPTAEKEPVAREGTEDMGIQLDIEPYKPLRLKTND